MIYFQYLKIEKVILSTVQKLSTVVKALESGLYGKGDGKATGLSKKEGNDKAGRFRFLPPKESSDRKILRF
ncbi:hypothetical protein [Streptococcus dentiloxodontae]